MLDYIGSQLPLINHPLSFHLLYYNRCHSSCFDNSHLLKGMVNNCYSYHYSLFLAIVIGSMYLKPPDQYPQYYFSFRIMANESTPIIDHYITEKDCNLKYEKLIRT